MKALIIYNPFALRGKIELKIKYIKNRFMTKYEVVDILKTESSQDAVDIAKSNIDNYDIYIVIGGDGTLHQVCNGIAQVDGHIKVGLIPLGTVNDVAHILHIPNKINKAIDIILRGKTLFYDLIFDGSQYIVYTLAGGMFIKGSYSTSSKAKSLFGKTAYYFKGFFNSFCPVTIPLTIESYEFRESNQYLNCIVLNSYNTAGFFINGESSVSDGKMEVVLIKKKNKNVFSHIGAMFTLCCMFLFGLKSIKKFKNVSILYTDRVRIENHSNVPFTADGEKSEFLITNLEIKNKIEFFHGLYF